MSRSFAGISPNVTNHLQLQLQQRKMSGMRCTRIGLSLVLLSTLSLAAPRVVWGQDEPPVKHGRKYKAPPDTSHVEVPAPRHSNGKPIVNAAVVFNPSKDG